MSGRFAIRDLPLLGLKAVERQIAADERGYLDRLYSSDDLGPLMGFAEVAQVNRSLTVRQGTVRGMHFQVPPHSEAKLVTCVRGAVFDVAVDLRAGSTTFLQWHGEVLDGDRHVSMLIPEGFAHGFQALTNDCELLYVHSARHDPTAERRLNPRDPKIGIEWPEPIRVMSVLDATQPMIPEGYSGILL